MTVLDGKGVFEVIDPSELERAKRSFVTRRIDLSKVGYLCRSDIKPSAGDLLLARVDKVGQHTRLESPEGRRQHLYPGDEILVCYGNRYATQQFEGLVPGDMSRCHLVAAGGIAANMVSRHSSRKRPTEITPLGLVMDKNNNVINVSQYSLNSKSAPHIGLPHVIAVFGSSMDSGKTTTVANLIRGIKKKGLRVGAAKVTGTGSGPDQWRYIDAGADVTADFTDAGFASTYREPLATIEHIGGTLLGALHDKKLDFIILEFADGLLQPEMSGILKSNYFHNLVDGVVYAAPDSLSATYGLSVLQDQNWPVLCVSGLINASPLHCAEYTAKAETPLLDEVDLIDGLIVDRMNFWFRQQVKVG